MAGAVLGESGRRFERIERYRKSCFVKLSPFLIWDMMMIPCGTCSTSDLIFRGRHSSVLWNNVDLN